MDDMLLLRLNLLSDAGEIDEKIKYAIINFLENFKKAYSIEITEENGSMLVTHLAMALARIKRGEEIDTVDEEIFKEVKETNIYKEIPRFYAEIENELNIQIPEVEKDYIALHVCTLIEKSK